MVIFARASVTLRALGIGMGFYYTIPLAQITEADLISRT